MAAEVNAEVQSERIKLDSEVATEGNKLQLYATEVQSFAADVSAKVQAEKISLDSKVSTEVNKLQLYANEIQSFAAEINAQVQAYWLAAVPVVVIGAPLGAFFCNRMHYLHIRYLLIALICLELTTSLWLLTFDASLVLYSLCMLVLFLSIMISMSKVRCYVRSSE